MVYSIDAPRRAEQRGMSRRPHAGTLIALSLHREVHEMLNLALTFFVIALIAAVLGFGGVAGMSADIGWLFAVLAVVVLVAGLFSHSIGGRSSTPLP
jgi:uncharacterized membrane protein YtjA (UPF0391 family)